MHPTSTTAACAVDAARRLRFEQQVMPHLEAAWSMALWLARAEGNAEDVLQEAMLRAYRSRSDCHQNARAWLLMIVRNTFYTMRREAQPTLLLDTFDETIHGTDDDACTPESQLQRDVDAQQLRQAIELLPVQFREVLVLREFEECSYKEVAEITGLKMGTVMSRLARARARLARHLSADA